MSDTYTVRRATMDDVKDIHALLMENARKGLLLPRALIFLYGHVRNFLVIDDPRGGLAACCALAPVWEDLAEVRSVAVHPQLQHKGIGRLLVQDLIEDARALGAAHVFTFTLAPGFFSSLGFSAVGRDTLSPVVWAECSKCPKFYKCDEVGMMLHF